MSKVCGKSVRGAENHRSVPAVAEPTALQARQQALAERRDKGAVSELVQTMQPSIRQIVLKYARINRLGDDDAMDLESEAMMICIQAIGDYDASRDGPVGGFLFQQMRAHVSRYARTKFGPLDGVAKCRGSSLDAPLTEDGDLRLIDTIPTPTEGTTEEDVGRAKDCAAVHRTIADLDPPMRRAAEGLLSGEGIPALGQALGLTWKEAWELQSATVERLTGTLALGRTTGIVLRDYQMDAVGAALGELERHRSTLYICPTGGGKTFVFSKLAECMRPLGRVLILTDRLDLTEQTKGILHELSGLSVGIEQSLRRVNAENLPDVVCATVQSISRPERLRRFGKDAFALIVIDEADLGIAASYRAVLRHFADAKVFGCTATPERADGKTLGCVFKTVSSTVEITDLIDRSYLSPVVRRLIRIDSVSLVGLRVHEGDYSDAQMERILMDERALHEVVNPTLELAGDRPTMVFAATVRHAKALADLFNRYRANSARAIDGEMTQKARKEIIAPFARGRFQFLCNCSLMLRGWNLPFVSCIAMARPTRSRSLYIQAIGRGTRTAEGKRDLLVIDFTDSSAMHSLITAVDALVPSNTSREVCARAKEILDASPGDVQAAVEQAMAELEADPEIRARVLARVAYQTRKLGPKGIDWLVQPLGKITDAELAQRLDISATAVRFARIRMGIPAFGFDAKRADIDWDQQPLGKESDYQIAKRFGVSPHVVFMQRRKRGIPPLVAKKNRKILQEIDWSAVPLGKEPDSKIAARIGVGVSSIRARRVALGIPVCPQEGVTDWSTQGLGEVPDREIAERLGVPLHIVRAARRRFGIAPAKAAKELDLIDKQFGDLTVVSRADSEHGKVFWNCRCSCGSELVVRAERLRRRRAIDCGHSKNQALCMRKAHRREYNAWVHVRQVGHVDEHWREFPAFYADMGSCPPGHRLWRPDDSRPFGPDNAEWTDGGCVHNHRGPLFTYQGQTKPLPELARVAGLNHSTVWGRLIDGWSLSDALETPVRKVKVGELIEFNGKRKTLSEWADEMGIPLGTVWSRIKRGWDAERALRTPSRSIRAYGARQTDARSTRARRAATYGR